ncbi:formate dehydrogenase accessory sulfurtransferase FdhD [Tsuneonella amylolytica]|uniref:formate dehydrogenase accessory sulfurtransferase FdhD n=1 Tax=Tsuneonella amylolytica TaxID=2338327 RepID=UPI0013C3E5CC|nr:formate dehydrogenase accessory sulfurtransferase FdhD [Tsuneonella amylolytica]
MRRILGAALAGGRSSRFGSDKAVALWRGRSLLDHTLEALRTTCADVVVCGPDADRRCALALTDRPADGLGPLGGLCAALVHARDHGFDSVLTAPVDSHPVPDGLAGLLGGELPAVVDGHWLFGLWPAALADDLEQHLLAGHRSVRSWLKASDARVVPLPGPPPVNVNTPAALAALETGAALGAGGETHSLRELRFADGVIEDRARVVPVEAPVGIEFNGIGYAVMMATPVDLEDFVVGFSIGEGLADRGEIDAVDILPLDGGWLARANLPARSLPRVLERARSRVSESGCGICGIESIAAALAPLEPVSAPPRADAAAVYRGLRTLSDRQPLGRATGAAHAAAFCSPDGEILCVREDVGRHNALDKLIGALAREGLDHTDGFVLLSARCSQELVEKTVRAGIPMLATISAPSSLAIGRAREGRLTLLALARDDSALVVNDPCGLFAPARG